MSRPEDLLNSAEIRKRNRNSDRGIYRNELINSDNGLVQPPDKIVASHDLPLFVRTALAPWQKSTLLLGRKEDRDGGD